ncbi:hypothetical protein XBP1_560001 [Xenorhabdus bovienii str. puntauvense]|uniref:Uncharacterized protein n=1 Tax=Xenorhabdus bovienii str. puntauvense TaxID=1398201 RepID=A0A077NKJ7_XENBV|nr:hypothetical protein XBFFR1_2550001 [Xenorhabdus bovienii str. feltiae France]CDG93660.1 hypothetical protein XBFFL1_2610018 [Xenorhabdus bovienii str. feltiae Florida]CDG98817.1 hypothetical protein XBP1_560001 [Xenorhabdus bovienii str. puntauvense]
MPTIEWPIIFSIHLITSLINFKSIILLSKIYELMILLTYGHCHDLWNYIYFFKIYSM